MHTLSHQNNLSKATVIWGVRINSVWKRRWQNLALILGVPAGRLITYVLLQWIENNPGILRDAATRRKLGQLLEQQDLELPLSLSLNSREDDEDSVMEKTRVNISIRGVRALTQLHLKALAIGTNQPIYRLVDAMVARAWQEIGDCPMPEEKAPRIKQATRKLFNKMVDNVSATRIRRRRGKI
jgi:hypothetical protein